MSTVARPPVRAARIAEITALYEQGLTTRQISERLGIAKSSVRGYITDPDRIQDFKRRVRNSAPCGSCGGPTNGSRGVAVAKCKYCREGKRNPGLPDLNAPTRGVRVDDIPLEHVAQGLWEACCATPDEDERYALFAAAVWPSRDRHRVLA